MNIKNNLSLIVAIYLFILTGKSMAQSICEANKTCSPDQFAAESNWIAQEFLDTKSQLTSRDKLNLKICLATMVSESTDRIFNGRKSLSAVQYKKSLAKVKTKFEGLPELYYRYCPTKDISVAEFADILTKSLTMQRAKTDFNDFRASPGSYDGQTVRISGYGRYAIGTFTIKSDPSDLNPIVVDLSETSRDERSDVIKLCGNVKRLCKVTVLGTYETSHALITITATGPVEFN